MEFALVWGGDPEDLTVTTSGAVSVEGLDEMVQSILADARYRPALRILIDHRRATWSGMTTTDIRRRIDLLERDRELIGYARIARVVSEQRADVGIGQMMHTFADQRTHMVTRIFTDIDDARTWLRALD